MNNSVNKKGDLQTGEKKKNIKTSFLNFFFLRIQYPLRTLAHMCKQ